MERALDPGLQNILDESEKKKNKKDKDKNKDKDKECSTVRNIHNEIAIFILVIKIISDTRGIWKLQGSLTSEHEAMGIILSIRVDFYR